MNSASSINIHTNSYPYYLNKRNDYILSIRYDNLVQLIISIFLGLDTNEKYSECALKKVKDFDSTGKIIYS